MYSARMPLSDLCQLIVENHKPWHNLLAKAQCLKFSIFLLKDKAVGIGIIINESIK